MKQFETFGEYMFDLLFAPLKKGRKTVNQLRIFFKVMGREFDDLKAAIFRVRSEANVASCSEVMLPVHGQDRDMPRLEGEDAEAYRTRLSMKGIISQWSGTRRGVLYALTALGYDRSRIELFADQDAERWAEFIIFLNSSKPSGVTNLSVIDGQVRKVKEGSSMVLVLTPADIFEQKEENARLYEALASLPEKQRNRITSHFLLGMSLSDIAKSEGTGVSSVHEGIQRGLRRLKKILEKMNTDPENYHQK